MSTLGNSFNTPFTPKASTLAAGFQGVQGGTVQLQGMNDDAQRLKIYGSQEVYIAGDNSGSMSGAKAKEASAAIAACMQALADPMNKDGFRVSFVSYGSSARPGQSSVPPASLTAQLDGCGGGTNLAPALRIINQQIDASVPRSGRVAQAPAVIVFSDGCLGDAGDAIAEAATLKAKGAKLICIGFGSDVDATTLQTIATAPDHYAFANVGQLRALFAQVGRTLSQGLGAKGVAP